MLPYWEWMKRSPSEKNTILPAAFRIRKATSHHQRLSRLEQKTQQVACKRHRRRRKTQVLGERWRRRAPHLPRVRSGDRCRTGTQRPRQSGRCPSTCPLPSVENTPSTRARSRVRAHKGWRTHRGEEPGLLRAPHVRFHLRTKASDASELQVWCKREKARPDGGLPASRRTEARWWSGWCSSRLRTRRRLQGREQTPQE